ncbi:Stimulated by retinoic acid gene 8 protein [Lonchura striata]|uniref:Stimulated by retinoic acid gene 8 protein n=1 Tax=Lonchura striata TaxID=40157 RepID=A0A218V0V6_9PASE|nr:Stimulated by retinoic acid gene 8 protein [Lonchura striata domestica]
MQALSTGTAGDCRKTHAKVSLNPLRRLQEVEHCMAKQHLPQAHHWVPLARLFSSLRGRVLSQSDSCASKVRNTWQAILTPCSLTVACDTSVTLASRYRLRLWQLLLRGLTPPPTNLSADNSELQSGGWEPIQLGGSQGGICQEAIRQSEKLLLWLFSPCVLSSTASASEDMSESDSAIWYLLQECEKQTLEEYGKPELTQVSDTLSPDLVEFERYLYFYKHTVDLLIEHGIVCTGDVPLPEVSTAISHLWQELNEESRDSILQYCSQRDFLMDPKAACPEPACTEGSVRDSGGNSEEASGSSVSTPEEVMFEDAFDVAAGFLDRSKAQGMSSQSSAFAICSSENPEDHQRLYLQVTDFLKHLFFTNTQFCQEEDLHYDHETVMLQCTETFDDEDF